MLLDAVGLGVFAVAGCSKALAAGLAPPGAILLGVMTAIGGGMLRDMMAAEVPRVLHEEVYALAAFAGAAAYVGCIWLGLPEVAAAGSAVVLAVGLRLASVHFGWRLPRPPREEWSYSRKCTWRGFSEPLANQLHKAQCAPSSPR